MNKSTSLTENTISASHPLIWEQHQADHQLNNNNFCTQDNIVVSGDKKGQVAVWDHERVHERTVYATMHRALTNNLRFLCAASDAACASASSDGLLKACPQTHCVLLVSRQDSLLDYHCQPVIVLTL